MEKLFETLKISEIDHIEFAVTDLDRASEVFLRLGFEKVARREILERKLSSDLYVQNQIRILLSSSQEPTDALNRFVEEHGEGVFSIGFRCEDAVSAFEIAVNRGAEIAVIPRALTRDFGTIEYAEVKATGNIRHRFVSRKGNLFAEGFSDPLKQQNRGIGLEHVDHLTFGIEKGQLEKTVQYYEAIFGFQVLPLAESAAPGNSRLLQNPAGTIRFLVLEENSDDPRIAEFLNVHHGSGVQHLAFASTDIVATVKTLRREGTPLSPTPRAYYAGLTTRIPSLNENVAELEQLGIQVAGDAQGYLLQISTPSVMGAYSHEIIQRKGYPGFGQGNFKATADALREDARLRGVMS